MKIKSPCPACKKKIEFPAEAAGRKVRCPFCKEVFRATVAEPDIVNATPAEPETDTVTAITSGPLPDSKPKSAKRKPAQSDLVLLLRVIHDPRQRMRGHLKATISETGLNLSDPRSREDVETVELPVGSEVSYAGGNRFFARFKNRDVKLAVSNPDTDQIRLARDLVAFLRDERPMPRDGGYRLPRWLGALSLPPLGILVIVGCIMALMTPSMEATAGLVAWCVVALLAALGIVLWARAGTPSIGTRAAVMLFGTFVLYVGPGLLTIGLIMDPHLLGLGRVPRPLPRPALIQPGPVVNDGWAEFVDPEKKFRIEFQGVPQARNQKLAEAAVEMKSHVIEKHQHEQGVAYADIPMFELGLAPAEVRFDNARNGVLKKHPGCKLNSEKQITLDGNPGREVVVSVPTRGIMVMRMYLVNARFYMLITLSPAPADAPHNTRFLESFKLIQQPILPSNIDGLLGYWSFDDDDKDQARDALGHLPARLHNATRVPGKIGQAIRLQGDGHLDLGNTPRFNFREGQSFTIAFWLKAERAQDASLLSMRRAPGKDGRSPFVTIALTPDSLDSRFTGLDGLEGWMYSEATLKRPMADGSWHHVAVTHASDGSQMIWLDGLNLAVVGSAPGAIRTDERKVGVNFSGQLDEFCIYGRALLTNEIKALAGKSSDFKTRKGIPAPFVEVPLAAETRPALLGKIRFAEEATFANSLHYSSDGKKLFAGVLKPKTPEYDGGIQVWDPDKNVLLSKAVGNHLHLIDGGRLVAHFDGNANVRILDIDKDVLLPTKFPGTSFYPHLDFFNLSPNGDFLFHVDRTIKDPAKVTIRKFDVRTGDVVATWPDRDFFRVPVHHPGGECFAVANAKSVQIVSSSSGKVLLETPVATKEKADLRVQAMAFSPDGKSLALCLTQSPGIAFLDLESGIIENIAVDARTTSAPARIVFTPNGKYLLGAGSQIMAVDVAQKKLIRTWISRSYVNALAIAPDGRQLAIARSNVKQGPAHIQTYDLAAALGLEEDETRLLGVRPALAPLPDRLKSGD